MGLYKILKIVASILALAGIVFAFILINSGELILGVNDGQIGNMLIVAYIIFAIVLLFVVIFTLQGLLTHPDALKSTLTGLGAFAVVALICYFVLANGVETPLRDGKVLSAGGSKLVGAGLYMFYALGIIACGTMLLFGLKKMIK